MKLYIIKTGFMRHDINTSFALAVQATQDNPEPKPQWFESHSYAVLIEHPQAGWILYDMGSSPDSNEQWPESISNGCSYFKVEGETMQEQLDLLDLKPGDIDYVIMSHMHMDHIGNIHLFEDTAEFFVARREAEHAFCSVMSSQNPAEHGFYSRKDVLANVRKLNYIDEEYEIFPGIHTILLPGHTPMVLGLRLEMEECSRLLVSDALFSQRSLDGWMAGTVYDTVGWRKSRERLQRMQSEYDAEIFFGHDPDQNAAFRKLPEYYK